jgi:uncharacterized membrane protein
MNVEQLGRIGRILFAAVIAFFGLGHFMNGTAMAGMSPSWLPGGVFWVYLTGALLVLSAIAIIAHRQMKWAAILLALMLFSFVFFIHLPNLMHATEDGAKQLAMANILKDAAMAAAALVIASTARK